MKTVALLVLVSSCLLASTFIRTSGADQAAPIVIPMGESQPVDTALLPNPSPAPLTYACTMPQEAIRERVALALAFTKHGSYAKAQHVLQLLLNDL